MFSCSQKKKGKNKITIPSTEMATAGLFGMKHTSIGSPSSKLFKNTLMATQLLNHLYIFHLAVCQAGNVLISHGNFIEQQVLLTALMYLPHEIGSCGPGATWTVMI
jgi:hypothetical protein